MIAITDELFEEICIRIENDESLTSICALDHMPTMSGFFRYITDQNSRSDEKMQFIVKRYDQARLLQGNSILARLTDIETTMINGERNDKMGSAIISSMKWRAKVSDPNRFGEKAILDHTGSVASTIQIVDYSSHSPVKQAQSDPGQVKPIAHPTPNDE